MAHHAPQNLDLLLDKLAGDDAFRQSFLGDPQGTLDGLGIAVDASLIPAVRCLPTKEVIAASRAAMKGKTDNVAAAFPFFLGDKR